MLSNAMNRTSFLEAAHGSLVLACKSKTRPKAKDPVKRDGLGIQKHSRSKVLEVLLDSPRASAQTVL